ncbi:hypothetical protein [Bacillus gobiensis]|uniref:hypothetical protein n=1 Tax=Bacillus gobiensis TaxID=1441095 RepID=UPI003D1E0CB2
MTSPTLQTYFIQQTPESPDLALSLNTSVLQFGIAFGAGFGGLIVNSTGTVTNTPLLGGCLVIVGMIAAFASFSIQTKKSNYPSV